MKECVFCKIISDPSSTKVIYEDNEILAFHDLYPKAQIHFLIIPKVHIESMLELKLSHTSLMGNIMVTANQIAQKLGMKGYKTHINTGKSGGQEVFHLHVHILGNKT